MARLGQVQCRPVVCIRWPRWSHTENCSPGHVGPGVLWIHLTISLLWAVCQALLLLAVAFPLPSPPHVASCKILTQMFISYEVFSMPPGAIAPSPLASRILFLSLSFVQHPFKCPQWTQHLIIWLRVSGSSRNADICIPGPFLNYLCTPSACTEGSTEEALSARWLIRELRHWTQRTECHGL